MNDRGKSRYLSSDHERALWGFGTCYSHNPTPYLRLGKANHKIFLGLFDIQSLQTKIFNIWNWIVEDSKKRTVEGWHNQSSHDWEQRKKKKEKELLVWEMCFADSPSTPAFPLSRPLLAPPVANQGSQALSLPLFPSYFLSFPQQGLNSRSSFTP